MPVAEVRLEEATEAHVDLVAPRMRSADCLEILASGGYTPADAIRASLAISSFARTAFIDGEAAAIFGIVERADGVAIPWLLTTYTVDRFPLTFWKASKVIVRALLEAWPNMLQAVDVRYTGALSWARRLGFTVREPEPFGEHGLPFSQIEIGG